MLTKLRAKLTYANVVSSLCLFLVVSGGTAYAVTQLDRNSVRSKHIVNGQVRTNDVEDDGLTGADIAEGALGQVPSAAAADAAQDANTLDGKDSSEFLGAGGKAADANTLDGKDSSEFVGKGSENWNVPTLNDGSGWNGMSVSPWVNCRWANFGGGMSPVGFFRDPAGVVHLRGVVRAVDGSAYSCGAFTGLDHRMFDLPSGYRPSDRGAFSVVANNKPGRVDVLANGTVQIEPAYPTFADARNFVSLDGISFRCAPSGQNGCP